MGRGTTAFSAPATRELLLLARVFVRGVVADRFSHDVAAISEAQVAGAPVPQADPGDSYALALAPPKPGASARAYRLNEAALVVLEACDGRRTVDQIVSNAERRLSADGLEPAVRGALMSLSEIGLVEGYSQ